MNDEEKRKSMRSHFEAMRDMAEARRAAATDAGYQYKLSKGAPRDVAYEKWGATITSRIEQNLRQKRLVQAKKNQVSKFAKQPIRE